MTIKTSGAISVSDINAECAFNVTTPRSLNDTISRYVANIPSGIISMSDFYGKALQKQNINVTLTGHTLDLNVKSWAIAYGWNQIAPLNFVLTINGGVILGSSSIYSYALDTSDTFPSGFSITVYNYGYITGRGGDGGGAGRAFAGDQGGNAVIARVPITMYNYGIIQGGGGGGGSRPDLGWGGGAGGAGYPGGNGGIGGGYSDGANPNGTAGSLSAPGSPGVYYGGSGGYPGQAGGASPTVGPQPGGAAGYSIVGYGNVGFGNYGTVTGPVA